MVLVAYTEVARRLTRSPSTDWGVSWLELVVNFRLVTGCDIPIMLEWDHATASAEWLWPTDDKVNLLPFGVLGVARQIKVLSGCICQLERLGGKKLTFGKRVFHRRIEGLISRHKRMVSCKDRLCYFHV